MLLAALLEEVVEELRARGPVGAGLLEALDHVVAAGRAKDTSYVLWEEQGGGGEVVQERGLFLWVVMERLRQQDEQAERDRVALGRMAGMLPPVDPAAEGGGAAGPARRDSAADVELLHRGANNVRGPRCARTTRAVRAGPALARLGELAGPGHEAGRAGGRRGPGPPARGADHARPVPPVQAARV